MKETSLLRYLSLFGAVAALSSLASFGTGCGGSSSGTKDAAAGGKADVPADVPGRADGGDAAPAPKCSDAGAHLVSGEACGCSADCQSAFCVDGVCCDSACGEACKRCDVQGSMGTCSLV